MLTFFDNDKKKESWMLFNWTTGAKATYKLILDDRFPKLFANAEKKIEVP